MENNRRPNVRFIPAKIRTDKKVAIYCRVSTTRDSQAESESLSEAIKWGLRRGFETGESKFYARKCFGYKHNEQGELIINEEQAIEVRKFFDLYLKGYSVDMIMKDLADNNIQAHIQTINKR